MANEVTINLSLQIKKSDANIDYTPRPTQFRCDMNGSRGQTPGEILVGIQGTEISLAHIASNNYGYIRLQNRDATNRIHYGIRDPDNNRFYPMGVLYPGEPVVWHMSSGILGEQGLTGTGTSGADNQLWAKAEYAPCLCLCEAFEG